MVNIRHLIAWGCLLLLTGCGKTDSALRLENFAMVKGKQVQVQVDLSGGEYRVARLPFKKAPPQLLPWLEKIRQTRVHDIGQTDEHGIIKVSLQDEVFNSSDLLVFLRCNSGKDCRIKGYLEVIRQPEALLKSLFGFEKVGGYNVLGRTTLQLPHEPKKRFLPVQQAIPLTHPLPDLESLSAPEDEALPPEVRRAGMLIRYIWSYHPRMGPSNDAQPQSRDALYRLGLLKAGQWAVSCQGIRDIFVELAAQDPEIPAVRTVGLYQYSPAWPDLISNSHAVAEIYSEHLDKWIMIDPHFGTLYTQNGIPLSVSELSDYRNSRGAESRAGLMPLKVELMSNHDPANGLPDVVRMPAFDYLGYFGTMSYTPVRRTAP